MIGVKLWTLEAAHHANMKNVIQSRLSEDQRNVARLLRLMSRELDKVEKAEPANLELLQDIMQYMTTYPDQTHHPLEDAMYQQLRTRHPPAGTVAKRMFEEHLQLSDLASECLHVLQLAVDGGLVERTAAALRAKPTPRRKLGSAQHRDQDCEHTN